MSTANHFVPKISHHPWYHIFLFFLLFVCVWMCVCFLLSWVCIDMSSLSQGNEMNRMNVPSVVCCFQFIYIFPWPFNIVYIPCLFYIQWYHDHNVVTKSLSFMVKLMNESYFESKFAIFDDKNPFLVYFGHFWGNFWALFPSGEYQWFPG